jgi:CheY-like chemotaxis protein
MATVLVVDDTDVVRRAVATLLEHDGHSAVCATNGLEALNRIKEGEKPDLVLLDLAMPQMGGLEALERLRATPETRDIPVVVVTSQDDSRMKKEAIRRGATAYWVKSHFSWDHFCNRLDPYLPRRVGDQSVIEH